MQLESLKKVKQVCTFLGLINFIKNHIKDWAAICKPIMWLTRKDIKFVWWKEREEAFKRVKAVILEAIMLKYPNPNRTFDLYSDTSSTYGMGGILMQDGNVVSTFSRKFNDAQLKIHSHWTRALGVCESMHAFWSNHLWMRYQNMDWSSTSYPQRHSTCEPSGARSTNIPRCGVCPNC